MRVKGLVVAISASAVLLFPATAGYASNATCTEAEILTGNCPPISANVGDGYVEVSGSRDSESSGSTGAGSSGGGPGSPADGGAGAQAGGSGGSGGGGAPAPIYIPPLGDNGFGDYDVDCVIGAAGHCIDRYIPDLPPAEPVDDADADADDAATIVTISDIASFTPRAAVQYMQPDRWMVVGLPANFYAQIDQHVVSGTLLGEPADVRFTPRAYSWSYGDGATAVTGTPGNTWQALGLAEFDPTATSHVYTAEGTYVIDLTVLYTAEYRWASGPWTGIAGHVELPANPLVAEAASDAVTVLVDRDCAGAPTGPGC